MRPLVGIGPRLLDPASYVRLGLLLSLGALGCSGGGAKSPHDPGSAGGQASTDGGAQGGTSAARSILEDGSVPIDSDDPVWGSRDAPLTLVEFSDFECPFCARGAGTVTQLKERYGPERLRVVFKNRPLEMHPHARFAAEVGAAVFGVKGSDAFFAFHDVLFRTSLHSEDDVWRAVTSAGLTELQTTTVREAVAHHAFAGKVASDVKEADAAKVEGTPLFLLNGLRIEGAQPIDRFVALIDAALEQVKMAERVGVPRMKLYAELSKVNAASPPKDETKEEPEDPDDRSDGGRVAWKVPVGASPVRWAKEAPVTIVEFSDFQCPFCSQVEPTLEKVHQTYGDQVRLVWKDEPLPFHKRARPAAELAREARVQKGNAGFWAMHDLLFTARGGLDQEALEGFGKSVGLDGARIRLALDKGIHEIAIEDDEAQAAGLKASGTPHFFVNGRRLVGAAAFESFQALIDEELVKAKALIDKGMKVSDVYEALTKGGREPVFPFEKNLAPVDATGPSEGPKAAPVTIVEYADFECPYCSRGNAILEDVKRAYGGRVRVVWKDFPLPMHEDAPLAAEAAAEAYAQKGNEGFWKMHAFLFDAQRRPDGLKRESLDAGAKTVGLDMTKWASALDGHTHAADMTASAKRANDELDVHGTPTFFVNGYRVRGALPFSTMRRVIDRALVEAKAKPGVVPGFLPTATRPTSP